ncbi:MAG: tetratricopeptide repeat protein, partial [Candidatus Acidiferrales bacterium]
MRTAQALLALAIGVAAALPASAAKPETWTEAHSAHFHVVTNAKPKAAADAVHKLEEFRHLLSLMYPRMRLDPPTPARVILFRNNKTFEPYTPRVTQEKRGRLGGFMQGGDERMYLAINLGLPEPQPVVFHEYIHLVLALNMGRVPTWLNEGLAEFYEQSEINGVDFTVGNWQPGMWQVLQDNKPMPLAEMVRRDYNQQPFKDQKEMHLFYAESWLLVHYLMVADEAKRRPQFVEFVQLLMQGVDQDRAFTQALGTDYAGMEKQLRDYLDRTTLHVFRGKMAQAVKRSALPFSPMEPTIAEAYLTDLWFNRGDVARAEQALQALAQAGSPPPEVLDRLGRVALRQGNPQEAEKHLQAALAARPNDLGLAYYTAWAISQGRMGRAAEEGERRAAATQVIGLLSPHLDAISSFPHAYHLLISARMARNDAPADLIPVVERARTLMPTEREFDLLLAHLYERAERWDDAEKLLIETTQRAEDPEERQRAEQML